ncbi:MAG: DNA repair protein RadC [Candidatus Omnitrophica bacterium]|nr:DNA repair protein RadC [Candidatus Omnitrophota bacterium]
MSIKSWPNVERPRERLIEQGAEVLSESELLAILLRNGIHGKDAVALSREMLKTFGGLRGLLSAGKNDLKKIKGLGFAKIAILLAASEIAKRQLKSEMIGKNVIRDPRSVLNYLTFSLRDHKREIFKVLFLDKGNRMICEKDLFEGTIDEAAVHPREVVKAALENHATAIILVHNHPSGRAEPSPEDREITRRLQAACATISVRILDHIIIGDNQHFSFNEHQML